MDLDDSIFDGPGADPETENGSTTGSKGAIPIEEFYVPPPFTDFEDSLRPVLIGGHGFSGGRLPVLDPQTVHHDYLSFQINDATLQTAKPSVDDVISAYVPTQSTMQMFEKLDVLVCGRCQSTFHLIDEFKSHSTTCEGKEGNSSARDSSEYAVAMVLWCNTIRRKLQQTGTLFTDNDSVGRKIQTKWFSLSKQAKSTWLRAARSLRDLGEAGRIVFGSAHYADLVQEVLPSPWAEGETGPLLEEVKKEVADRWSSLGDPHDVQGPIPRPMVVLSGRSKTRLNHLKQRRNEKGRFASALARSIECQTDQSFDSRIEHVDRDDLVAEIVASRINSQTNETEYMVEYRGRPDGFLLRECWQTSSQISDPSLLSAFHSKSDPPFDVPRLIKRGRGRPPGRATRSRGRPPLRGRRVDPVLIEGTGVPTDTSTDTRSKRKSLVKAMNRVKVWAHDRALEDEEETVLDEETYDKVIGDFQAEFGRSVIRGEEDQQDSKDLDEPIQVIQLGGTGPATLLQADLPAMTPSQPKHRKRKACSPSTVKAKRRRSTDVRQAERSTDVRPERSSGVHAVRHVEENSDIPAGLSITPVDESAVPVTVATKSTTMTPSVPTSKQQRTTRPAKRDTEVPPGLAALVPPGYEMVKHINDKGKVEYRLKRKPRVDPAKNAVGASNPLNTKVVELGKREPPCDVTTSHQNVVRTILLGGAKSDDEESPMETTPTEATPVETISAPPPEEPQQFVKLTYKPTLEDARPAEEDEVTSSTTEAGQMHEVSTTTAIVDQQEPQCSLDPSTGLLYDKHGQLFHVPKQIEGGDMVLQDEPQQLQLAVEGSSQLLQLAEDGSLLNFPPETEGGGGQAQLMSVVNEAGGTANKILILMPNGHMFLTDLPEGEQHGRLNIQVAADNGQVVGVARDQFADAPPSSTTPTVDMSLLATPLSATPSSTTLTLPQVAVSVPEHLQTPNYQLQDIPPQIHIEELPEGTHFTTDASTQLLQLEEPAVKQLQDVLKEKKEVGLEFHDEGKDAPSMPIL